MLISTAPNPSSFDDFADPANATAQLYARYWASEAKTGNFCIPLDLSGLDGVADGTNVTIQVALTGGDGQLYQVCFMSSFSTLNSLSGFWTRMLIFIWL